MTVKEEFDLEKIPQHVAIIMDGNGRWAENRHLPRTSGHAEGVKRVEEIIEVASKIGIKALTLYTFSIENWTRPQTEISMLLRTLCTVLNNKINKLMEGNIKFRFLGREEGVPDEVLNTIRLANELTKKNTGMILNMAFNYGARVEILHAVKEVVMAVEKKKLRIEDINEKTFSDFLYTKGLPDPDLLIRTSGEKRISNFLLWQVSYSELYFTDKYWPDFGAEEFQKALFDYQNRERRYGNIMESRK